MLKETPLLKHRGQKLPHSKEILSVCKQLKKHESATLPQSFSRLSCYLPVNHYFTILPRSPSALLIFTSLTLLHSLRFSCCLNPSTSPTQRELEDVKFIFTEEYTLTC